MMEQIAIVDILDKKDKSSAIPEVWSCMESCAVFTDKFPQGGRDHFPGTKTPRCIYAADEWKSKLIDNVWHTWCMKYRPKEG